MVFDYCLLIPYLGTCTHISTCAVIWLYYVYV